MVDGSSRSRKPRIRKAPVTVREKIESGSQEATNKPKRRLHGSTRKILSPLSFIWAVLRPILRLTAPLGRPLIKILGWLAPSYFINSWRELKLVTWPNRRETWRLTGAVFVFAIVFGALVWVVDLGLDQLFKRFVLR